MLNRPALSEIVSRTRGDLLTRLSQDELLRRSDAEVLARVLAGASHEIHGYLDRISRQIIYDIANEDMLIRWASIWGVGQKPAVAASGHVLVTGAEGKIIPADTLMKRADGVEFTVTGLSNLRRRQDRFPSRRSRPVWLATHSPLRR